MNICRMPIGPSIWPGRYVIMPDYLHLFVAVPLHGRSLSDWIKSLKNALSKSLRAKREPAPHWQKGFIDHALRSRESYAQKWEYVRSTRFEQGL